MKLAAIFILFSFASCAKTVINDISVGKNMRVERREAVHFNNDVSWGGKGNDYLVLEIKSSTNLFKLSKMHGARFNVDAWICEMPLVKVPNLDLAQNGRGYLPDMDYNQLVNPYVYNIVFNLSAELNEVLSKNSGDICFTAKAAGAYLNPYSAKTAIFRFNSAKVTKR